MALNEYKSGTAFSGVMGRTGTINTVTIEVSSELIEDDEDTMRRLMAHQ